MLEEPLLGRRFVEGEEVGTKNKVECFPLLRIGACASALCMSWNRMGENLGFPCAFMHLSASKHTIEGEAAILVDRGESVEVEVPTADTWGVVEQSR